jgi:deoxyribodipyrimidine photo-lyase
MTKLENGLFIFRRDLRIHDNVGLLEAHKLVKQLYTCFIFTPEQVSNRNDFKSTNSIQFMIESLEDLKTNIEEKGGKLLIFYGKNGRVVEDAISKLKLDAVFFNKDYSPYAKERDEEIEQLCEKNDILCESYQDYYLFEPGTILTGSNQMFKKYTPFYNATKGRKISKSPAGSIKKLASSNIHSLDLKDAIKNFVGKMNEDILVHGGRKLGLQRLHLAKTTQKYYGKTRDFFDKNTSHLSAYIKFGCVSIREVYQEFSNIESFINELTWREFFAHVLDAYPEVVGQSYQKKFRKIKWSKNKSHFEKWKQGNTGVPIVDACMRELNSTGYMHNRGRMTVASFLIKTLLIDWRWGEKYFAQQLTDYDIASNNGNWQGISGTGVDMKPYFRDMNPWIQSAKFDKDAKYIKKWVPELEDVPPHDIHKWYEKADNHKTTSYPKPMIDYFAQKDEMMKMYKEAS